MYKFFTILFVLTAQSCGHFPYLENSKNKALRQCSTPVLYGISSDFPDGFDKDIESAFEYWNKVSSIKFFVNLGRVPFTSDDRRSGAIILVSPEKWSLEDKFAIAWSESYFNGCFSRNVIYVASSSFKVDLRKFQTIMRHEAGHVLGLAHSPNVTDLMYYTVEPLLSHPRSASKEEIESIKKLYQGDVSE